VTCEEAGNQARFGFLLRSQLFGCHRLDRWPRQDTLASPTVLAFTLVAGIRKKPSRAPVNDTVGMESLIERFQVTGEAL
jgi:hypothetical protein